MSVQSAIVLALVLALAAFAIWRNIKKGAPCECGSNCGRCRGGGSCCGEDGQSHTKERK